MIINIGDVVSYKSPHTNKICNNLIVLGKSSPAGAGSILLLLHPNEERDISFIFDQNHLNSWSSLKYVTLCNTINLQLNRKLVWINNDYVVTCTTSLTIVPTKTPTISNRSPGDPYIDGACCSICGNFSVYANPGFTCYSCSEDPFRASILNIDDPID